MTIRLLELPTLWTVLLDIAAWLFIHLWIARRFANLPVERFDPRAGLYRPRKWESGYQRLFQTRLWKRFLPDAAPLLGAKGFAKRRLAALDRQTLAHFGQETCRAELTHWCFIPFALLFFLWNAAPVGGLMVVYILVENLPIIAVQRYNRARLIKLEQRRELQHGH